MNLQNTKKCLYYGEEVLSIAKKYKQLIFFFSCIVIFSSCSSSNTDFVKDSVLADFDRSISIGDALDNYKYFTSSEWDEFTTSQGREIVEFKGYYFKNNVVVKIQFRMNKDLQEDADGASFIINYQGYIYTTENGEQREKKDNSLIREIYNNREITWLSSENLLKY